MWGHPRKTVEPQSSGRVPRHLAVPVSRQRPHPGAVVWGEEGVPGTCDCAFRERKGTKFAL